MLDCLCSDIAGDWSMVCIMFCPFRVCNQWATFISVDTKNMEIIISIAHPLGHLWSIRRGGTVSGEIIYTVNTNYSNLLPVSVPTQMTSPEALVIDPNRVEEIDRERLWSKHQQESRNSWLGGGSLHLGHFLIDHII